MDMGAFCYMKHIYRYEKNLAVKLMFYNKGYLNTYSSGNITFLT